MGLKLFKEYFVNIFDFIYSLFGSNMHAYGNGMSMTGSQIPQQQQQQGQPQQQQQAPQQQQQQQAQQNNQVNSSKLSSPSSPSGYSSYFGGPIPNGGSDNNMMCRPVH